MVFPVNTASTAQSIQWLCDRQDDLGFKSLKGARDITYSKKSGLALRPNQPPCQCTPGALSLGVKPPRKATTHSPQLSAKVHREWN